MITNNPIALLEWGKSSPIPYPSMKVFWRALLGTLYASGKTYLDPLCFVEQFTNFEGRNVTDIGKRIEEFFGEPFIILRSPLMTRNECRTMCERLAKAICLAMKVEFDIVQFEHGFEEWYAKR